MTPTFPFALGVFQGCVLSPVLFNICFQSLLDSLHHMATSNGWNYSFKSNPSVLCDTSAYADDLEICSWSVTCCQAQLDLTNSYLLWSRSLQARPNKCFARALSFDKAGHFGPIHPNLSIGGTKINNLGDADFKYLGKYLNTRSSEVNCRKLTMETLESLLETFDTTPLMASTKIWLYHHFVTTKVGWSLLINDLCLSFVKDLQAAATRSLKALGWLATMCEHIHSFCWRSTSMRPEDPEPCNCLEATAEH